MAAAVLIVITDGVVRARVAVLVQPFASVAVIVYVNPGEGAPGKPVIVAGFVPVGGTTAVGGIGLIDHVINPVPPEELTVMVPVLSPKHCGLVEVGKGIFITAGFTILAVAVPVHPQPSVTVIVYEPCGKLFHEPGAYCVPALGLIANENGGLPPETVVTRNVSNNAWLLQGMFFL